MRTVNGEIARVLQFVISLTNIYGDSLNPIEEPVGLLLTCLNPYRLTMLPITHSLSIVQAYGCTYVNFGEQANNISTKLVKVLSGPLQEATDSFYAHYETFKNAAELYDKLNPDNKLQDPSLIKIAELFTRLPSYPWQHVRSRNTAFRNYYSEWAKLSPLQ